MWIPYLRTAENDSQIDAFAARAKEETGFTDFYFISREGKARLPYYRLLPIRRT